MPLKSTAPHSFSQTNKAPPITRVFFQHPLGIFGIEYTNFRELKKQQKTLLESLDPSNVSGLVCIQQIGIVIEAFSPGHGMHRTMTGSFQGVLQAPTCKRV